MSLINQMLRDLQERRDGHAAGPYAKPPVRSRQPHRRTSITGPLRSLPPLLWVGVGGVAGLALWWGVAVWLSGEVGPDAVAPVPAPPPELVAVVERSPAAPVETPPASRRTPPVPIDVPPPTPPLAYGASASAEVVPVAPAEIPPAPAPAPVSFRPATAMSQGSTAFFSDRPAQLAGAPTGGEEVLPASSGSAMQLPARVPVHPLPEGVIRAADLALRKKTGTSAVALPLEATPYVQAGQEQPLDLRKRTARTLRDRGDVAGAVRALTGDGLPHIETDPELHRMLAALYLKLGENFLAAQTYRNLTAYDPRDGASWLGLGDAQAADGQTDEAHQVYRQALEVGGMSREDVVRVRGLLLVTH